MVLPPKEEKVDLNLMSNQEYQDWKMRNEFPRPDLEEIKKKNKPTVELFDILHKEYQEKINRKGGPYYYDEIKNKNTDLYEIDRKHHIDLDGESHFYYTEDKKTFTDYTFENNPLNRSDAGGLNQSCASPTLGQSESFASPPETASSSLSFPKRWMDPNNNEALAGEMDHILRWIAHDQIVNFMGRFRRIMDNPNPIYQKHIEETRRMLMETKMLIMFRPNVFSLLHLTQKEIEKLQVKLEKPLGVLTSDSGDQLKNVFEYLPPEGDP